MAQAELTAKEVEVFKAALRVTSNVYLRYCKSMVSDDEEALVGVSITTLNKAASLLVQSSILETYFDIHYRRSGPDCQGVFSMTFRRAQHDGRFVLTRAPCTQSSHFHPSPR